MISSAKYFSFFIIFLFFSCNDEPGSPAQNDSVKKAGSLTRIDSLHKADSIAAKNDPLWTDSLSWKGAMINGNLPVFGNLDQLQILGKPDSVLISPNDCGSPLNWLDKKHDLADTVIYYYYPGMIFYTNRHNYFLSGIDIQKHHLVLPKLNWNQNYSAEKFATEFPRSVRNARLNRNKDSQTEQDFKISYENRDDCWILKFKNGKLNYVKLWWLLC